MKKYNVKKIKLFKLKDIEQSVPSIFMAKIKFKKVRVIFMKREEIIETIKKIEKISNELIQTKEKIKDEELEKYFCKLEKVRMDMYDAVMQENLWRDFMGDEVTEFIDYDYKAKVEDDILKKHVPEKIPPIKKGANYTRKKN